MVIFSGYPVKAAGPGTLGADFINLAIGSRAIGMGDAQSAIGKDASVMYFNPAGLGNLKTGNLTSMHSSFWFSDVSYTFIGCAVKSNKTVMGIGGTMLSINKATGVPIIYVGVGQGYDALERFDPKKIAETLLGRAFWFHWLETMDLNKIERTWMNIHIENEGSLPELNGIYSPTFT